MAEPASDALVFFGATGDLAKRYPNAQARDFDGNPAVISEADALIAYLQMLGTSVNFRLYDGKANIRAQNVSTCSAGVVSRYLIRT